MTTHNIAQVTSALHCDNGDFSCTVTLQDGNQMRLTGARAISMFFSMIDIFIIDEDEEDDNADVH